MRGTMPNGTDTTPKSRPGGTPGGAKTLAGQRPAAGDVPARRRCCLPALTCEQDAVPRPGRPGAEARLPGSPCRHGVRGSDSGPRDGTRSTAGVARGPVPQAALPRHQAAVMWSNTAPVLRSLPGTPAVDTAALRSAQRCCRTPVAFLRTGRDPHAAEQQTQPAASEQRHCLCGPLKCRAWPAPGHDCTSTSVPPPARWTSTWSAVPPPTFWRSRTTSTGRNSCRNRRGTAAGTSWPRTSPRWPTPAADCSSSGCRTRPATSPASTPTRPIPSSTTSGSATTSSPTCPTSPSPP